MKTFVLVYNPVSGDASFKYKLDDVIACFQRQQCMVIPFRVSAQQPTSDFVRLAKQHDVDGIIVSGGDGTIHEVINSMIQGDLHMPLGIIPSGTSNDFAAYLNLEKDIDQCIAVIASGCSQAMDIGRVNDKYFFNVASAGLLTSVAHNADAMLKNTLGKMAYYLKGLGELPNFRALKMQFVVDDVFIEEDVILFLIMNSGTVGGFSELAPNVQINDGKLDLMIVRKCNLAELMKLFINSLKGVHYHSKQVRYLQGSRIRITCNEVLESDVDGERGPLLPLEISVLPQRIRVFCQPETLLPE